MSKPTKSVRQWLSEKFGSSIKAISENLSPEQYNQFVEDASKIHSSEDSDEDEPEDDESDDQEEIKNQDPKNNTVEARLQALETGLKNSQTALKEEKKNSKTLQTKLSQAENKLTETESKLTDSEKQKTKLRSAVNPLGDEDATTSAKDGEFLTQADIDARESYNRRKAEE